VGWDEGGRYVASLLLAAVIVVDHAVVDFIDESAQVAADLGAAELNRASGRPARRLMRIKTAEKIPQTASGGRRATELSIRPASYAAVGTALSSGAPSTTSGSPRHTSFQPPAFQHTAFQHRRHTSPAASSISSLDGSSSLDWQHDAPTSAGPFHAMPISRASWPLADPEEAHLFRFYVDTVSQCWDVGNSQGIFKQVVPQLALSNSMLLNAVLMKASQHIDSYDASYQAKPYLYHERVVQQLIPYLTDNGRIQDEATLVAAIFLRGFEEWHGTYEACLRRPGESNRFKGATRGQCHLSTYELFHGPDGWLLNMASPIVQACYMAHVRFEIYQTLLNIPSLRGDYRTYVLPALAAPADNVAWGNQIAWFAGRCLQWAQSDSRTLREWQQLNEDIDEWERERPSGFSAFYYREADMAEGRHFPDMWFPTLEHGMSAPFVTVSFADTLHSERTSTPVYFSHHSRNESAIL
jgi:hypothetical protein